MRIRMRADTAVPARRAGVKVHARAAARAADENGGSPSTTSTSLTLPSLSTTTSSTTVASRCSPRGYATCPASIGVGASTSRVEALLAVVCAAAVLAVRANHTSRGPARPTGWVRAPSRGLVLADEPMFGNATASSGHPFLAIASSASIFLLAVLLTRLFSVILFYHLAFVAILVGMLGLAASGSPCRAGSRMVPRGERRPRHSRGGSTLHGGGGGCDPHAAERREPACPGPLSAPPTMRRAQPTRRPLGLGLRRAHSRYRPPCKRILRRQRHEDFPQELARSDALLTRSDNLSCRRAEWR